METMYFDACITFIDGSWKQFEDVPVEVRRSDDRFTKARKALRYVRAQHEGVDRVVLERRV